MEDRFYAKLWIHWVYLLLFGSASLVLLVGGWLFWFKGMRDAVGELRPDFGRIMFIFGLCFLPVAAEKMFGVAARMRPLIRCYREGIEFRIIGRSTLDGLPFVPFPLRIAWPVLSLSGFRSHRMRLLWSDFRDARVSGFAMAYVLTCYGLATDVKTGKVTSSVSYPQVAFRDSLQHISDMLNVLAIHPDLRENLPSWSGTWEQGRLHGPQQTSGSAPRPSPS